MSRVNASEERNDSELSTDRSQKASSAAEKPNYISIPSPWFYSCLGFLLGSVSGTAGAGEGELIFKFCHFIYISCEMLFESFQPTRLHPADPNLDISFQ